MRKIILFIIIMLSISYTSAAQFTYSGYIKNADGTAAVNVPVKLYQRTTPNLTGFTSQNNYNGHSYYRSTGSAVWTTARQNCVDMGGHLVTVTSSSENSFIYNLWPSGWIGLTDEVTEGTWKWVTGETYSYSSWNGGEPNNSGNEDYVQFVSGGKWNDLNNSSSLPYVIEFEYIVTYTSWVLYKTVYTDATGKYTINETTNPSIEWYLQLDAPNPSTTLQMTDIVGVSDILLAKTAKKSIHWNMYDVNGDGNISISDAYYINMKRVGFVSAWIQATASRYFTPSQYTSLTSGVIDLRSTIPGVSSITITSPVSGTTNGNYYLIAPGYKSQVSY
jgi:hypothetical protein